MAKRKSSPSTSTAQNFAIKDLTRKRKAQKKRLKGKQTTLREVDAAIGALYDAHAHAVQHPQEEGAPSVPPERVNPHDGDIAVQALERTLRGL